MMAWETFCRALADERARREEQAAWRLEPGARIPYRLRWEHVQLVAQEAERLARLLGADRNVCVAAAWLHDIRKTEPQHALRGAEEAAQALRQTDFPAGQIEAVAHAIRHHEGLFRPESAQPLTPLETAILWDADKLTKLGVPQLAQLLSGPRARNMTLRERRALLCEYVERWIDRTARSMNTEPGRAWAAARYQSMVDFLRLWPQA